MNSVGSVIAKTPFVLPKVDLESKQCRCGKTFKAFVNVTDEQFCHQCLEERHRLEGIEQDRKRRADATRRELRPRFQWASFDAPELAKRVKPASCIEKACAATSAALVGFLGDAGKGKTSLACALLLAMAADRNKIGRFTTAFELAEARRQHRLGAGESGVIATAMNAGVLLIDEIGAELGRDTAVDEVIRVRHDYERPTIWTSGFNRADIANRYGAGVERRLFEGATIILLGGGK